MRNNSNSLIDIEYSIDSQTSTQTQNKIKEDGLNFINKTAYSVGHVVNDITFSFLLVYMMYYFTMVIKMSPNYASYVWFIAQMIDGLATPIMGFISDITDSSIGKRKPIYIIGYVLNVISILMIFNAFGDVFGIKSLKNKDYKELIQFYYYTFFFSLYNIGFAAIHIGHLSLIPTSSANDQVRSLLVSYRTTFTFVSGILSMIISVVENRYTRSLNYAYLRIVYIITLIGSITSLIFIVFYPEVYLTKIVNNYYNLIEKQEIPMQIDHCSDVEKKSLSLTYDHVSNIDKISLNSYISYYSRYDLTNRCKFNTPVFVTSWLGLKMFWVNLITYVSARVTQNFSASVMSIYIKVSSGSTNDNDLVYIPFLYMLNSFLCSLIYPFLIDKFSKKSIAYACNVLIITFNILLYLNVIYSQNSSDTINYTYLIYFLLGGITSIYLTVATCLISDLIGIYVNSGATVYGLYGLADRAVVGLTVFLFFQWNEMQDPVQVASGIILYPIILTLLSLIVLQIDAKETIFGREDFDH